MCSCFEMTGGSREKISCNNLKSSERLDRCIYTVSPKLKLSTSRVHGCSCMRRLRMGTCF